MEHWDGINTYIEYNTRLYYDANWFNGYVPYFNETIMTTNLKIMYYSTV